MMMRLFVMASMGLGLSILSGCSGSDGEDVATTQPSSSSDALQQTVSSWAVNDGTTSRTGGCINGDCQQNTGEGFSATSMGRYGGSGFASSAGRWAPGPAPAWDVEDSWGSPAYGVGTPTAVNPWAPSGGSPWGRPSFGADSLFESPFGPPGFNWGEGSNACALSCANGRCVRQCAE